MSEDLKFRFDLYCTRLRQSGAKHLLSDAVEVVGEVGDAFAKPNLWTVSRAAMSVAGLLTGSNLYPSTALDKAEWVTVFPECLTKQLVEILQQEATVKSELNDNDNWVRAILLPGVRIAWTTEGDFIDHLSVGASCIEKSVDYVRERLWQTVNPDHVVLTVHAKGDKSSHALRAATDDGVVGQASAFASEFATYMQLCLDAGVPRTVLFYGPPGTGKSTIARQLCDLTGLRSLRIRVEDIGDIDNAELLSLIAFFAPDVVIVDDLDRTMSQVALLETLQNLHSKVRFVFATVNDVSRLDDALLRPGRFDEIIPIRTIDPIAVRKALGEFVDAYDDVSQWPIAFVNEYVIRRRLLGREKANLALEELRSRVMKLSRGEE